MPEQLEGRRGRGDRRYWRSSFVSAGPRPGVRPAPGRDGAIAFAGSLLARTSGSFGKLGQEHLSMCIVRIRQGHEP
jgi:hypothetical protein